MEQSGDEMEGKEGNEGGWHRNTTCYVALPNPEK